eukprot:m.207986 g.207986  ORF g.207986 m.207986 type:complete len:324 (-) comp23990_c0_seq1:56-1027(-)
MAWRGQMRACLQRASLMARPSTAPRRCYAEGRPAPQTVELTKTSGTGLLTLDLPSNGPTVFSIEPASTVAQFARQIADEDSTAKVTRVFDFEGNPVAGTVRLATLATEGFQIVVNDRLSVVNPIEDGLITADYAKMNYLDTVLAEVKKLREETAEGAAAVLQASTQREDDAPNAGIQREITVIEASLDAVNEELREYEPIIARIQAKGKRSGQRFWMITLAAMSAQFGFLAELTFNQFSWDLMEPVTYFVTYFTSIALLMYYISTFTAFKYEDISDRQRALAWHKEAKREGLSLDRYNWLHTTAANLENRLTILRAIESGAST